MYTPERGVDLTKLRDDVKFLKRRYALDIKGRAEGRLVLRCVFLIYLCGLLSHVTRIIHSSGI